MFSNHRSEISFLKEFSLFILVLSFATFGYFITIPSAWHPYLPDVFFVAWCVLYAKYRYRHSHSMHYVVAWIFGLTADFFTSGSLGANALTYLIIALWADQFDIAPKQANILSFFEHITWYCPSLVLFCEFHVLPAEPFFSTSQFCCYSS